MIKTEQTKQNDLALEKIYHRLKNGAKLEDIKYEFPKLYKRYRTGIEKLNQRLIRE